MTIIEDEIGEVVASMRNLSAADAAKFGITAGLESPYYFYGHVIDINTQMINRDKELDTKGKVYPALGLRLPVIEELKGGMMHFTLNLGIFAPTLKQWNAPMRMEEIIKPTLVPLLELFFDRLKKHGFTWAGDMKRPPCTIIKQPHHGVEDTEGNKAYKFSTPLDAIELRNLKINYTFKPC